MVETELKCLWTDFIIAIININHFQLFYVNFMKCVYNFSFFFSFILFLYCRLKIFWTIFYRLSQVRWPTPWNWTVHMAEVVLEVQTEVPTAAIRIWLSNKNHLILPMQKCMHLLKIVRKRITIIWVSFHLLQIMWHICLIT